MKKVLTLALAVTLAAASVVPVMATAADDYDEAYYYNENDDDYDNDYTYDNGNDYAAPYDNGDENGLDIELAEAIPAAVSRTGYITDYDAENQTAIFESEDYGKLILHLDRGTAIVYAYDGSPATLTEGAYVKLFHPMAMALIYPPQTSPFAIIVGLDEVELAPNFHVISSVEWEDDTLLVKVDNGGLIIRMDEDTPLNPHLTRQIVTLDSLQPGDELLFWYSTVAQSIPAQTTASRALFIRAGEVEDDDIEYNDGEYNENDDAYGIVLIEDGDLPLPPAPITIPGTGIMRDGAEFFPVRATATIAGFEVMDWNADTSTATLSDGYSTVLIASNSNSFYLDGETVLLYAKTIIIEGRMYATADFFAKLVK